MVAPPSFDDLRSSLALEQVARLQTPLMLVSLPSLDVAAMLVPVARNGGIETWRAPDGVTLSFRDGVLVSTRGLGHDLMAVDRKGALRSLHYLDGAYRFHTQTYACASSVAQWELIDTLHGQRSVARVVETCKARDRSITNVYKRGSQDRLWWSRQWVGPEIGYLETELIKP